MLLNHDEICELIDQGVIENADYDCVNGTSLDIHLGPDILVEQPGGKDFLGVYREQIISLAKKDKLNTRTISLNDGPFYLYPNQFILAHSREIFNLPLDISAEYKLKSSMARITLEHLNAGWCDPGWHGSVLTMEIKNMSQYHTIILDNDVRIGQMVFFRSNPVPEGKDYATRGRYNNDKTAVSAKR